MRRGVFVVDVRARRTTTRCSRAVASASSSEEEEEEEVGRGNAGISSRRHSRRGALGVALGSFCAITVVGLGDVGGASTAAAAAALAVSERGLGDPLRPLEEYRAALDRVKLELDAIAADLRASDGASSSVKSYPSTRKTEEEELADEDESVSFDEPAAAIPLTARERAAFKGRLHDGELGYFWVTSRGTDRYMMGQRSPFARDQEDLWKLLPEKSGPLGRLLQPDFDNADDKLCLVYSCVNDPRAPPSIDVLYSLKLLDEGLATEGVTAKGLLSNVQDSCAKLDAYLRLVDAQADPTVLDDGWRNPAPTRGWGKVGV